jgi:hypothetical protein
MTPKQFVVDSDRFGLAAKPSGPRTRVVLVTAGLIIVAFIAWRWAGGESGSQHALQITVLGVRDVPAPARGAAPAAAAPIAPAAAPAAAETPAPSAQVTVEHTPPPVSEAAPRAAAGSPAPPAPARSSAPSRAVRTPSSRSSASRAAAAGVKPVVADEPHVETVPTKPAPTKPDSPPLETNPYVYK